MTDLAIRVVAFLAGLLLTAFFLKSVSSTVLVNRQHGHWLARRIDRLAYSLVVSIGRRRRSYNAAQEAFAWLLPIYMLLLIVVWFLLAQLGFSLIIWSVEAEHSFGRAAIASGSALSTLGFMTPAEVPGQILAILEGAVGLGIVVFFFTFIPGYQSTVQLREARTAWLYARAGQRPAGFAFLNWAYRRWCIHGSDRFMGFLGRLVSFAHRNAYCYAYSGIRPKRPSWSVMARCGDSRPGCCLVLRSSIGRERPCIGESLPHDRCWRPQAVVRTSLRAQGSRTASPCVQECIRRSVRTNDCAQHSAEGRSGRKLAPVCRVAGRV